VTEKGSGEEGKPIVNETFRLPSRKRLEEIGPI